LVSVSRLRTLNIRGVYNLMPLKGIEAAPTQHSSSVWQIEIT
jgi:hypothetical protein